MKEALKLARDWIAERPADRPVSAGKMISIIDRALAKDEQSSSQEPDGPIADGWCINFANGHSGMGVYAHMDDYPEEGAILLCGVPKWAIDALAQPEQDHLPVSMRMPQVGDKVICLEDESIATVVYLTGGGSPEINFEDGSRGTYLLREFAELFGYVAQHGINSERNFCPRCGKRTPDPTTVHTCTPPGGALSLR